MDSFSQYQNQSQCQDYKDYGPNGYHPVYINQIFNSKYKVIQKLGWGHFSTVWIVQNLHNQNYYALKIHRSKQSHTQTAKDQIQLLKIIRAHQNDPEWIQLINNKFGLENIYFSGSAQQYQPLQMIDSFIHQGMNGKHYCCVFELMGPNLLDIIQHYEYQHQRMPLGLIKRITKDVLIGLVYLHNYCKIIHTDIKPENIMLKLTSDQQKNCIEGLKKYKKKPLSMKYLANLQKQKRIEEKKVKQTQNHFQSDKQQEKCIQISHQQKDISEDSQKNTQQLFNYKRKSQVSPCSYSDFTSYNRQSSLSHFVQDNHNSQMDKKDLQSIKKKRKIQQNNLIKTKIPDDPYSQDSQYHSSKIKTPQQIDTLQWKKIKIYLQQNLSFKIADYGNATLHQNHFSDQIQTRQYRSPQVIIGHPYEYNADIWSLACVVFQMLTNTYLFKPKQNKKISQDYDHLYKMMEVLGHINIDYLIKGSNSQILINAQGQLVHGNPRKNICLSNLLNEDFDYTLQQSKQIEKFLKPMLQYQPSKRINALECLKSPWLWKK